MMFLSFVFGGDMNLGTSKQVKCKGYFYNMCRLEIRTYEIFIVKSEFSLFGFIVNISNRFFESGCLFVSDPWISITNVQ